MKKSQLLLPLLITFGFCLTGCGSESNNTVPNAQTNQSKKESAKSINVDSQRDVRLRSHYLKPGAAVVFNHDYDGKTAVSEVESINVQVLPSFDMEALRIRVTSVDGVMVGGDISFQGSAIGQQPVTIPVSIQSSSEGRYYLNVHVDSVINGLKQSRSFALPVIIGNGSANAKTVRVVESNGELIRVMPASEKP